MQPKGVHTGQHNCSSLACRVLARGRDAHTIKERVLQDLVAHAFKPTEKKDSGREDRQRDLSSGSNTADSLLYSMHV